MKTTFIKILYNINFGTFIITIVLMISIYLGLLFEILLGFIQILSSLLLLIIWKQLSIKNKKRIFRYWLFVIIYFTFWLFNWDFLNEWVLYLIGIAFIPLCISWFLIKILESVKNEMGTAT